MAELPAGGSLTKRVQLLALEPSPVLVLFEATYLAPTGRHPFDT